MKKAVEMDKFGLKSILTTEADKLDEMNMKKIMDNKTKLSYCLVGNNSKMEKTNYSKKYIKKFLSPKHVKTKLALDNTNTVSYKKAAKSPQSLSGIKLKWPMDCINHIYSSKHQSSHIKESNFKHSINNSKIKLKTKYKPNKTLWKNSKKKTQRCLSTNTYNPQICQVGSLNNSEKCK